MNWIKRQNVKLLALFMVVLSTTMAWLLGSSLFFYLYSVDERNITLVLQDHLISQPKSVPIIYPRGVMDGDVLDIFLEGLPEDLPIPLGGVPNIDTIFCREDEGWQIYKSDRYGFNNPDHVYSKAIDTLLLGDSFVHGACTEKNLAHWFRRSSTNSNTVSLGMSGSGTLHQFLILREFLAKYKVKNIVWFIFENDPSDTLLESNNEFLSSIYASQVNLNYFYRDFSSWTINAAKSSGEYLEMMEGNIAYMRSKLRSDLEHVLYGTYVISNFRKILDSYLNPETVGQHEGDLSLMKNIMGEAALLAEKNGTNLHFVLLPSKQACVVGQAYGYSMFDRLKKHVDDNVQAANIFDFRDIFESHSCRNLFAFKSGGHLISHGYKVVADHSISKILSK